MTQCNLFWQSGVFGWVRCCHEKGHTEIHEPTLNSKTFIVVGAESSGVMGCFWNKNVS